LKAADLKEVSPLCNCAAIGLQVDDNGPFYTQLGFARTEEDLRHVFLNRLQVPTSSLRMEKVRFTGKEGVTSEGCPIAKWVIRRTNNAEKYLVIAKERYGHQCQWTWIAVILVDWDGISGHLADTAYDQIAQKTANFAQETERMCGRNKKKTCACQGLNTGYNGASYTFGCSWTMYSNCCKFCKSTDVRKYRLSDASEENCLETICQNLTDAVTPSFAQLAPDCFNNMCLFDQVAKDCRIGASAYRPFSGITTVLDYCAHSHRDNNNMIGGCTVIVTLTKPENRGGAEEADDEQFHVLPLYVPDATEAELEEKVACGGIEALSGFHRTIRIRNQAKKGCKRGRMTVEKKRMLDGYVPEKFTQNTTSPKVERKSPMKKAPKTQKSPKKLVKEQFATFYHEEQEDPSGDFYHEEDDQSQIICYQPGSNVPIKLEDYSHLLRQVEEEPEVIVLDDSDDEPEYQQSMPDPTPRLSTFKPFYQSSLPSSSSTITSSSRLVENRSLFEEFRQPVSHNFGQYFNSGQAAIRREPLSSSEPQPRVLPPAPVHQAPVSTGFVRNIVNQFNDSDAILALLEDTGPDEDGREESLEEDTAAAAIYANYSSRLSQLDGGGDEELQTLPHNNFQKPPDSTKLPWEQYSYQPDFTSHFIGGGEVEEEKEECPDPELTTYESECLEAFSDPLMGGVALALPHGSIVVEVAKAELHATTALRAPNRQRPCRIGLVFYQHKNLHFASHGMEECKRRTAIREFRDYVKWLKGEWVMTSSQLNARQKAGYVFPEEVKIISSKDEKSRPEDRFHPDDFPHFVPGKFVAGKFCRIYSHTDLSLDAFEENLRVRREDS